MVAEQIGEWFIEFDIIKTKLYYDRASLGCQCLYCENYRENCKSLTAEEVYLFDRFGIDPIKGSEFMEFGKAENGLTIYSGTYHFVGNIISGPNFSACEWDESKLVKIGRYKFGFSNTLEFVPNDFPNPIVQLELIIDLPWLVEES